MPDVIRIGNDDDLAADDAFAVPANANTPRISGVTIQAGVFVAVAAAVVGLLAFAWLSPDRAPRVAALPELPGTAIPLDDARAQQVASALDVWARLASTGDTTGLARAFDAAGPQYAALEAQATGRTAQNYRARMIAASYLAEGRYGPRLAVRFSWAVVGGGSVDRQLEFELAQTADTSQRWRVWTTRALEGNASSTNSMGTASAPTR